MGTAPYTVRNVSDVEDLAVRFGRSPAVEARFARDALDCAQLGITFFRFSPGETSPWAHRHRDAEEIYVLLRGSATVHLGEEEVELHERDMLRVAPSTVRFFTAGPDGFEMFAFGPYGLEDVERVPSD